MFSFKVVEPRTGKHSRVRTLTLELKVVLETRTKTGQVLDLQAPVL